MEFLNYLSAGVYLIIALAVMLAIVIPVLVFVLRILGVEIPMPMYEIILFVIGFGSVTFILMVITQYVYRLIVGEEE